MDSHVHVLSTPVLLIIFNRLDTTVRVFEQIQNAQPQKLYIAADGPRKFVPDEEQYVKTVRDYVLANITWTCDVKTLFHEHNLGCKEAVSNAIDWLFSQEEMGIILEDDCLPTQSFFRFCQDLLLYYYDNPKVWHINGNNFGLKELNIKDDYCFCNYPQVWGWATWKRAWAHYDKMLEAFDENRTYSFKNNLGWTDREYKIEQEKWSSVKKSLVDTWDYQWHFSVFSNAGLCIVPKKNQVSNIGFSDRATHTKKKDFQRAGLQIQDLLFPLSHPPDLSVNHNANDVYKHMMIRKKISHRILHRIRCLCVLFKINKHSPKGLRKRNPL